MILESGRDVDVFFSEKDGLNMGAYGADREDAL